MSLERFRRERFIVLSPRATAYQAARAMADNHVGAVLVSDGGELVGILTDRDLALSVVGGGLDPGATRIGEVMTGELVASPIHADLEEVARLMQTLAVRRIPLLEDGDLVGLVTFDDLVLSGDVEPSVLRAIVAAQLELEAPLKPAGLTHPARPSNHPLRALMRAQARSEATYGRLLAAMVEATQLNRDRAERAMRLVLCLICRRVTPDEAQHLMAQLPALLHPQLQACADGPDRSITAADVIREVALSLALDAASAEHVITAVLRVLAASISAGQIAEVKTQLPADLRALFPAPVSPGSAPPAAA